MEKFDLWHEGWTITESYDFKKTMDELKNIQRTAENLADLVEGFEEPDQQWSDTEHWLEWRVENDQLCVVLTNNPGCDAESVVTIPLTVQAWADFTPFDPDDDFSKFGFSDADKEYIAGQAEEAAQKFREHSEQMQKAANALRAGISK